MLRSLLVLAVLFVTAPLLSQTRHTTANFIVTASNAKIAEKVADAAERSRKELAVLWLGRELPVWQMKCPIEVRIGNLGNGG